MNQLATEPINVGQRTVWRKRAQKIRYPGLVLTSLEYYFSKAASGRGMKKGLLANLFLRSQRTQLYKDLRLVIPGKANVDSLNTVNFSTFSFLSKSGQKICLDDVGNNPIICFSSDGYNKASDYRQIAVSLSKYIKTVCNQVATKSGSFHTNKLLKDAMSRTVNFSYRSR